MMALFSNLVTLAESASLPVRVLGFILVVTLKGTALLLLAWAISKAFRRVSAAVRHLVWTFALVATLVLPFLASAFPEWHVAFKLPDRTATDRAPALPAAISGPALRAEASELRGPAPALAAAAPAARKRLNPAGWVLALLAAGWAVMGVRLVTGELRLRRLRLRARHFQRLDSPFQTVRARLRLSSAVEIRISPEVAVAMVAGHIRPVILLSEDATLWPRERLELVLAHELMHVKRRDCLAQSVAQIAKALYWFHPLVWLAASEMQKERERATDDALLALGAEAVDYAEHLVALARSIQGHRQAWSSSVAMAQITQLEARMTALLDPRISHRPLNRRSAAASAVLAAALLIPLAALRASAEKPAGSISGVVRDPSSAVIPDAVVTAVSLDHHTRIAVHTGQDGAYEFPSFPAGRYRLEVTKPGFAFTQTPEFELKPPEKVRQDVVMELGAVSEQVVVYGHPLANARPSPAPAPRRIRVGGLVQAAKLMNRVMPAYPEDAQERGAEGTVFLQAVIGVEGQVLSLKSINDADPEFVKAALEAVRQWRYQPTLLNGEPVEVVTTITVAFRLKEKNE
jgi:TonB family protein